LKCKQNRVWTLRCLESLAFLNACVLLSFLDVVYSLYVYLYPTWKPSLLYIVVWKRRWRTASTHKRVVWSLLMTNDLLRDMVIVLWRINFKSIPCMREHFCRQICYPCLVAKHDQSSGEGGCTIRTLVLFQRSWRSMHARHSKIISRPLLYLFTSLETLKQDKKRFHLWVLQLLMNFSFWWSCFWWRHHFRSTLYFRSTFLQTLQASFLLILLLFQNPLKI